MYDAWSACGEGDWKKSTFYLNICQRNVSKKRGTRKWLTAKQMDDIYGSEAAELIRIRKLDSEELRGSEVRAHPELPEDKVGAEENSLATCHLGIFFHLTCTLPWPGFGSVLDPCRRLRGK